MKRAVRWPLVLTTAAVLVSRLVTLPQTFWQGEEVHFARSLLDFDPLQQQPEPPGYPLYVALGRLLNFFIQDPFLALLVLSVMASSLGAWLVTRLAGECFGSDWLGAAVALVLYFSPAMLAFDALPNAEALGVLCVAAAFLALQTGKTGWFALAAGAAVAARPEAALAVLVMVLWRRRALPLFLAVVVIVFIPYVEAVGPSRLGFYAKTNYAALRSSSEAAGLQGRELLQRFIAHPWGSKWITIPLLVAAAAGSVLLIRRARSFGLLLAAFWVTHLLFCLAFADRTRGVQPLIPALISVAVFVVAAFAAWPRLALVLAVSYAISGFVFAWPLLRLRRAGPSPPARAMRYARQVVPRDAVLLYEPSMEAWARLSRFASEPVRAFDRFVEQPQIPLFLLADGGSITPQAARFEWPDSDIYGKVTTARYRVATLIPLPPASRYRAVRGVYEFERTADEGQWRWLAEDAAVELPQLGKRVVQLTLALPDEAPVTSNLILVNGVSVTVKRGQTVSVAIPSVPRIRIHAARTFSSDRDRRSLSVQLIGLEQR